MAKPDGYRYVRSDPRTWAERRRGIFTGERWALWEVQQGRARRVGTARSVQAYRAFLGLPALPDA